MYAGDPGQQTSTQRRDAVLQMSGRRKKTGLRILISSLDFTRCLPERGIDMLVFSNCSARSSKAHRRSTSRLLGSALHALAAGALFVVVVHAAGTLGARALHGVYALQLEVLGHGVGRGDRLGLARREHGLEGLDLSGSHGSGLAILVGRALDGCGELDVELDVKVAVVVVAV
jgi:hypothetical protein